MGKKIILFLVLVINIYAVSVKEKIYNDLNQEFQQDFGVWQVKLHKKTLTVQFENINMLYSKGSSNISNSFKLILKDFFPRYLKILNPYAQDIEKIEIDGYTSSENSRGKTAEEKYQKNLLLSQKRADGVLNYIQTLTNEQLFNYNIDLLDKLIAVGNSSSKLIYKGNGEEDKLKSRRIEFRIKFSNNEKKQDQVLKKRFSNSQQTLQTLSGYLQRLLKENPTLQKQIELLKATKQDIESSKAAFRPKLDLNYSYKDYSSYDDGTTAEKRDDQSRDITLRYNIFNKFKDQDQLKITKLNYVTTSYANQQVEDELVYSLTEAYVTVQRIKDIYQLSKENYNDYHNWVEKEKIRFQNGVIALRNFKKVEARAIDRSINFEEDKKRYNDALSKMRKYLDFDNTQVKYFKIDNPSSKYFENRVLGVEEKNIYSPYVKEAVNNIDLYKTKMKKSKVTFYPTIDLVGKRSRLDEKYKNSVTNQTTDESSLTLQANINLYAGGADQADFTKKLYEYKQKIAKKEEVIRDTSYALNLSYNKYKALKSKLEFAKKMVKTREEEYIAANYDYKFTKIDENDLLDVTDDVYNAKRQLIGIQYDFILSKYEILKNIGIIKEYILNTK